MYLLKRQRSLVLLSMAALLAMAGCGQKGPLTLASPAPAASAPASSPTSAR